MTEILLKARKTLDHHARETGRALRGRLWDLRRTPADRPIFIVGCSRAGTTLVYKTFSESREIGSLQRETHDYWSALHPPAERDWQSHALDRALASETDRVAVTRYFHAQTGRDRWVDKNNQNGLCIPYLDALFPDATFVFVKRDPGDNLNSLIEGWMRPDEFATWSAHLPVPVAVDGRYRQWCFFLAEGWRNLAQASLEEVCAFQYRALNEAVLSAREGIPRARWVELAYEAILQDPVKAFRKAFEGCGLVFDEPMERHCRGVLGRPYNAFSPIGADKWRDGPHRSRIERMLPALADLAGRLGYAHTL
ncbi:MAG: hypothetical protein RL434_1543 [Pseudomonadota bacterium]